MSISETLRVQKRLSSSCTGNPRRFEEYTGRVVYGKVDEGRKRRRVRSRLNNGQMDLVEQKGPKD